MTDEPRADRGWDAASFDGATREAMRRWAALPLEHILRAQEEMAELSRLLGHDVGLHRPDAGDGGSAD